MSEKKIIVSFEKETGENTVIEAQGFEGGACLDATLALEKALGGEVTERTKKPEMAQTVKVGSDVVKSGH